MKFFKKAAAIVTTLAMLVTAIPMSVSADNVPSDIKGHWAEDVLKENIAAGNLKGDEKGAINPNNPITRAEFMAVVNRILGLTKESAGVSNFKDVKENAWYRADVAKALEAGYITGISNDMMAPLATITNEQVYTILSRISNAQESMPLEVVADGAKVSSWAKDGVGKAIASGYVTGFEGKIEPSKATTRAQVIVLMDRYKKDNRIIAFPGKYNIKQAKQITVLVDGVTLTNAEIQGDLKLGKDVKKVNLVNCKIGGKIVKDNPNTEVAETEENSSVLKDGVYTGKAEGYSGDITVEVTIKNGRIVDAKVVSQTETPIYYALVDGLIDKIKEKGSLDGINAVAGATVSSEAIINAVKDALSQAAGKTKKPGETEAKSDKPSSAGGGGGGGSSPSKPNKKIFDGLLTRDGDYVGKAIGYGGELQVTVKVENKRIKSVAVDNHRETASYFKLAEPILQKIVDKNGTDVDTMAGATVSSKAILAAVEDALKEFTNLKTGYADGEWYGQGRGYYEEDNKYLGKFIPPTEVKVTIANGKVEAVELTNFGDDQGYKKDYVKIYDSVKKENNVNFVKQALAVAAAGTPEQREIYDTVAGATSSARGVTAAIENALERATKFKNDNINQEVRSLMLGDERIVNTNYGEPVKLDDLKLTVKYLDGREEIVAFKDLASKGIRCSLPAGFVPKPDDESKYDVDKRLSLTFTHEKSTAMHSSHIIAKRKVEHIELSRIEMGFDDGKTKTVNIEKGKDFYDIDFEKGDNLKVLNVEVFNKEGEKVEIDKWEVKQLEKPVLYINLKVKAIEPSDKIAYKYESDLLRVRFTAQFDTTKIRSITIKDKPAKQEYAQGDKLDLTGLSVELIDESNVKQMVELKDFAAYGVTVEPANGSTLDSVGKANVVVKVNDAEGNPIQDQFEINVVGVGKKVKTVKVFGKDDGVELATIAVVRNPDGTVKTTGYEKVIFPKGYNKDKLVAKAYDESGAEVDSTAQIKATTIKVAWTEGTDSCYILFLIGFTI